MYIHTYVYLYVYTFIYIHTYMYKHTYIVIVKASVVSLLANLKFLFMYLDYSFYESHRSIVDVYVFTCLRIFGKFMDAKVYEMCKNI